MRLLDQYRRLYALLGDTASPQPGLPALAEALTCSERNVRLLLSRMQTQGWLQWTPGRGRGHRSSLRFLRTPEQLAWEEVSRLLAAGELERAFAQLAPAQRRQVSARLPGFLGVPEGQGKHLRIPLHRPVETLDPLRVSSRLEAHLVREIFARLTRFDRVTQRLAPALAHHWEPDAVGRAWRFWLRPGLRFHDGSPLTAEDVRHSLLRLRDEADLFRPVFRHLVAVEIHDPDSFTCRLETVDYLWPHRLAVANASIVPRQRAPDFGRMPVGSGSFRVVRHNEFRLTLHAFDHPYGERALLDEIDLWVVPEVEGAADFDIAFGMPQQEQVARQDVRRVQSGCTYLMCNPARAGFGEPARRLGLADWLAPSTLFAPSAARIPAEGLLPEWRHRVAGGGPPPLPEGRRLSLITYDLPQLILLGEAIRLRLRQAGIELMLHVLSYPEFESRCWHDTADLLLASEVLHDDKDFSCYEWFATDNPFRRWLPVQESAWLDARLAAIQAEPASARRMDAYADLGRTLVGQGWLIPLSHETEQAHATSRVAGLALGQNGWMSFAELWIKSVPDSPVN